MVRIKSFKTHPVCFLTKLTQELQSRYYKPNGFQPGFFLKMELHELDTSNFIFC